MLLEICVASVDDAMAAAAAGADRLELNAALCLGGLSPSPGLLLEVSRAHLPLIVLVRPRAGGFCYSEREFTTMRRDVEFALEHGAAGIATGVLQADGGIDSRRSRDLARQIGDRQAIFHRAFDVAIDEPSNLERLIDLGFHRVLTSGRASSALEGVDTIRHLIRQSAGRIEILPAGGINASNAAEIVAKTGCTQLHASVRIPSHDLSARANPRVELAAPGLGRAGSFEATDAMAVRELRHVIDTL